MLIAFFVALANNQFLFIILSEARCQILFNLQNWAHFFFACSIPSPPVRSLLSTTSWLSKRKTYTTLTIPICFLPSIHRTFLYSLLSDLASLAFNMYCKCQIIPAFFSHYVYKKWKPYAFDSKYKYPIPHIFLVAHMFWRCWSRHPSIEPL